MKIALMIIMLIINIIIYRSLKVLRQDKYYYLQNKLKKIYYISGIFLLFFNMKIVQFFTAHDNIVLMWLSSIVFFYFFIKVFLHFVLGHHNYKYYHTDSSYNGTVSDKFMGF